jgi:hypothetical protein
VCSSGGHEDRERSGGEFMRFQERDFIFTERQVSTEGILSRIGSMRVGQSINIIVRKHKSTIGDAEVMHRWRRHGDVVMMGRGWAGRNREPPPEGWAEEFWWYRTN